MSEQLDNSVGPAARNPISAAIHVGRGLGDSVIRFPFEISRQILCQICGPTWEEIRKLCFPDQNGTQVAPCT